jgi:transketolase
MGNDIPLRVRRTGDVMVNEFRLSPEQIADKARQIRRKVIRTNVHAGQGHTGADLSEADILATLYFRILNIRRDDLQNPDRDRLILSKGHGVCGLYCTLAEAGYIDESLLTTYLGFDSKLPGHPVRQKTPAVELNTGALGHGMPVAVGLALSAKKSGRSFRVFVVSGDGELDEGSNWEAAMAAAHFKLDNLIWIVDRNTLQLADRTEKIMALEPLDEKFKAFGFDVVKADGNDPASLITAIEGLDLACGKPHVIIARTTKGKGVSFIEDSAPWHHKIPTAEELINAIKELE